MPTIIESSKDAKDPAAVQQVVLLQLMAREAEKLHQELVDSGELSEADQQQGLKLCGL